MNNSKKNNEPKISVIIPVYNTGIYLEQCINSIKNQTYSNTEIIVVDDGSNNLTKTKINELSGSIDILITQKNQGQSTARNVGIRKASGEHILVLDSDDYFEKNFCKKAIEILLSNESIKIITSDSNIVNNKGEIMNIYSPSGGDISEMILNNTAMGSCMFKKSDWLFVNGYDENMRSGFEDWEFYIRLLSKGGAVYVIKELLFNYRKGIVSTTTSANKIKYDLLNYIYKKNEHIYKQHFTEFIPFLLTKIEREEKEKIKTCTSLEYRIGFYILRPLRYIKNVING